MSKVVELALDEPMYSTYHFQGPCTAITAENRSVRNWVLNEVLLLTCNRSFLVGKMTPEINVVQSSWLDNPYIERMLYTMNYAGGYINPIIRNLLDHGYYICFGGIDDFYVKGKSWYLEKHFEHDGMICGYNQKDKTYCIYAYDSNWIYRKFWTPQRCFNRGREAVEMAGGLGEIYGIRVKPDTVEFAPKRVYEKLLEYLDSDFEKYPTDGKGNAYGIIVHDYLAMYIGKQYDGSVPYDRKDSRVFRLLWEHKKVMLERIVASEKMLQLGNEYSMKYDNIVSYANSLRMMYASHQMKRRDSILPLIQNGLLRLKEDEEKILVDFTNKLGEKVIVNESVDNSEKENE